MKKKHYLCTVLTKIYYMADDETTACKGSFFYSLADIEGLLPNTLCVSCNGAQSM